MLETLCKNKELNYFLKNFPKQTWRKAIEGAAVYGVRMFKTNSIPLNYETILEILSTGPQDLKETLGIMKKELYELSEAIKRIEEKSKKNEEDEKTAEIKFPVKPGGKSEKMRACSSRLVTQNVQFKERPYTPSYLQFSKELKEPKVCDLDDAKSFTKIINDKLPKQMESLKAMTEQLKSKGSISTQPTSPQFLSMMSSPRDLQKFRYG